ncbi:MAG: hypothetical protein R3Y39_02745 [Rikenellaceae bacterium]
MIYICTNNKPTIQPYQIYTNLPKQQGYVTTEAHLSLALVVMIATNQRM